MIRGFRKLVAQAKGEVTAEVTVAEPLSDDASCRRSRTRSRSMTGGKAVDLDVKVDPAIIGGLDRQARLPHDRQLAPHQTQCAFKHAMKEVG